MTLVDVVDLSSDDDELEELDVKPIKIEPNLVGLKQPKTNGLAQQFGHQASKTMSVIRQGYGESRSVNTWNKCGNANMLGQGNSHLNGSNRSLTSSKLDGPNHPSVAMSPAPICLQFWKAGTYNDVVSNVNLQNGKNYLQVHPMFLHSNATSHKWAFGAVAELLDNAIDEIPNGATSISVDKITNPRNGSSALLFQDNGGGMSPEAMRRCMSFGFTDKKANSAIGRYGNGFKTSTMRLGADVIVFSCHLNESVLTQSIGLLSYTFLRNSGYDKIVVPMVHYKYNTATQNLDFLHGKEHFMLNLSLMLQWSPYSTEHELLKQFNSIGRHGTKVIIYNLWHSDDGVEELDYSDPKDIRISGETKKVDTRRAWTAVNEQHIGYRYRYSLRAYMSILYLKIPKNFEIILRGQVVKHHNLADDLKYPEFILYKPQSGSGTEVQLVTTIGFLKETPQVNLHGFNVYHKNRLILPFWQVVSYLDNRGRGVVGVLEANFVEPTHNKQDFEKTSLFQKLEVRLKQMTWEYWDLHCALVGYQVKRKPPKPQATAPVTIAQTPIIEKQSNPMFTPVALANVTRKRSVRPLSNSHMRDIRDPQGLLLKRNENDDSENPERMAKRLATLGPNGVAKPWQGLASELLSNTGNQLMDQEAMTLKLENQKLQAKCLEYEKEEDEFKLKVSRLISEIKEVEIEHSQLMKELQALESTPKQEKDVA